MSNEIHRRNLLINSATTSANLAANPVAFHSENTGLIATEFPHPTLQNYDKTWAMGVFATRPNAGILEPLALGYSLDILLMRGQLTLVIWEPIETPANDELFTTIFEKIVVDPSDPSQPKRPNKALLTVPIVRTYNVENHYELQISAGTIFTMSTSHNFFAVMTKQKRESDGIRFFQFLKRVPSTDTNVVAL